MEPASIMGVMKMGNIVPRGSIEATSLAFWASVLTIPSPRLPDVIILPAPISPCVLLLDS